MINLDHPFANRFTDASLSLSPTENPDWGYARNKRCVLMVPSAEWVQSVFSTEFELNGKKFVVPNRDYPYEGLLVYQDGENWKFIDCIALAIQNLEGSYLSFLVGSVKVNPWQVSYSYSIKDNKNEDESKSEVPFFVSYYLNSRNTPELITGCIELYFPKGLVYRGKRVMPTIQPFLDIRHMYAGSNFCNYRYGHSNSNQRISISNYNRNLFFYLPPVKSTLFDSPELLDWYYKLGTGSRTESADHQTVFIGENKCVASFFNFQIPTSYDKNIIRLFFGCGLDNDSKKTFFPPIEKIIENTDMSKKEDNTKFEQLKEIFPLSGKYRDAILARIVGLTKFKIYVKQYNTQRYIRVPPAGAWWFRSPWYRDVFEGILNSFETLMKIPEEKDNIKEIISIALQKQDKVSGRILNRLPEYKHIELSYSSSDNTLLCFIAANTYIEKTNDLDFAKKILPNAEQTIRSFQYNNNECSVFHADDPPRVDPNTCLLLSAPHHSWMDTRTQCAKYAGWKLEWLPNRVSQEFVKNLYDGIENKEKLCDLLSSPNFFLPEINAQWIVMLKGIISTIDFLKKKTDTNMYSEIDNSVKEILVKAEKNFKKMFWNDTNGYFFNVVYRDGIIKDEVETEPGVITAAMLGKAIFSQKELMSIWNTVKKRLLVTRRLVKYGDEVLPFGIITKNEDQRIYYNDNQYHSDVVWLRSTPYLINLLRLLGENKVIEDILVNTVDHQMSEGAIFYNQELFSKPFGNNPHTKERTCKNPVPVKNPIQYWSQWCDGFEEQGSM